MVIWMGKSPAFQFYPKDFLSDINVASMTMEERGIYITLLSYCWLEGCLKGGSQVVEAICNHPENWDEIWDKVSQCFYEKDGKFYHKRLEEERKKQEEWREKSRLGGIKSGKARRKFKGGLGVVEPKGNTSSSSSSIKKINKEKYGEFVLLTKNEYNKLIKKYSEFIVKNKIEDLNNYIGSKGDKYKSHYHTLLAWLRKDNPEKPKKHEPSLKELVS